MGQVSNPEAFIKALDNEDAFFPFSSWPRWAKKDMLTLRKDNKQRYGLTRFFTLNGMSPDKAREWILQTGATLHVDYDKDGWPRGHSYKFYPNYRRVKGELVHKIYDGEDMYQINWLTKKLKKKKPGNYFTVGEYYDLFLEKVLPVPAKQPHFPQKH